MASNREIGVTPGVGDSVGVVDSNVTDGSGNIITAQAVAQLNRSPGEEQIIELLQSMLVELRMLNILLVEGFSLGTSSHELRPAVVADKTN